MYYLTVNTVARGHVKYRQKIDTERKENKMKFLNEMWNDKVILKDLKINNSDCINSILYRNKKLIEQHKNKSLIVLVGKFNIECSPYDNYCQGSCKHYDDLDLDDNKIKELTSNKMSGTVYILTNKDCITKKTIETKILGKYDV